MSKLDELIVELCPDGVEYKTLEKLCKTNTPPKKISSKNIKDVGDYPVIDQGAEFISGFTNDEQAILQKNEYIIFGDHTENIKFVDFAFAQGADGIKILTSLNCNCKYLYYCFSNNYVKTGKYSRHWSDAKSTLIPVPPLPVQNEIVRILDNFTELTIELTTELTTELTARKKQYEYYRDSLLSFGDDVEWKTLGECVLKISKIRWGENKEESFQYIDLSSVNRDDNKIYETKAIYSDNAPSRAQQIVVKNDVIFGSTRPMLKRYCLVPEEYDNQICSTGFCVLRANLNLVLPKWVFYNISTSAFYTYVEKNQKGASYPAISDKEIKAYKIPLLPIDEQQRIIDILDRFDTLCNDITTGLSVEIEARQKQYEYYRDKLLTFEEKS